MSLRRSMIRSLDRPGGRKLLGMVATGFARRVRGDDARIFYDGGWLHRLGSEYIPDGARFDYYENTVRNWPRKHEATRRNARDYWFHLYEPQSGDVIVDIGAGLGSETPVFSQAVGPAGRVLAVEAHPTTFRHLKSSCKWNRLHNVTPCSRAISDRRREVYIEDNDNHEGNAVTSESDPGRMLGPISAVSLDELCAEHGIGHIDFLKMNIEGAERLAIRGMTRMIQRTRHVCIACHDFRGADFRTKSNVIEFLRDNSFDLTLREEDPREYVRDHVHGVNRRFPSR